MGQSRAGIRGRSEKLAGHRAIGPLNPGRAAPPRPGDVESVGAGHPELGQVDKVADLGHRAARDDRGGHEGGEARELRAALAEFLGDAGSTAFRSFEGLAASSGSVFGVPAL